MKTHLPGPTGGAEYSAPRPIRPLIYFMGGVKREYGEKNGISQCFIPPPGMNFWIRINCPSCVYAPDWHVRLSSGLYYNGSDGARNFFLPGHHLGTTISNGVGLHIMTQRPR